MSRAKRSNKPIDPRSLISEADVQRPLVDYMRLKGADVLVVNAAYSSVLVEDSNGTKKRVKPWLASSPGVPDLVVTHDEWPAYTALLIECKKPLGWKFSCPEQKDLCERGRVALVDSLDLGIALYEKFNRHIRSAAA